mmetsp:Transcript_44975/g.123320  ORF Transcript_44975/g.123320 Transcript_44975/m.123320 type:complete len:235 (+) Transcript_44975:2861-3565(+)
MQIRTPVTSHGRHDLRRVHSVPLIPRLLLLLRHPHLVTEVMPLLVRCVKLLHDFELPGAQPCERLLLPIDSRLAIQQHKSRLLFRLYVAVQIRLGCVNGRGQHLGVRLHTLTFMQAGLNQRPEHLVVLYFRFHPVVDQEFFSAAAVRVGRLPLGHRVDRWQRAGLPQQSRGPATSLEGSRDFGAAIGELESKMLEHAVKDSVELNDLRTAVRHTLLPYVRRDRHLGGTAVKAER